MADTKLLRAATDVAEIMRVITTMSDDVTRGASPLDIQGRLLKLQSSLQKNRPRIVKLVDELCDMIEAETGKAVGNG
jgi:hypothetical protein